MKLDYLKLGNEPIKIKSDNTSNDSNYYTLLIGENGVGKTKIFEEIIKTYLDSNFEKNNGFKKIVFSAYTLFNRTNKYFIEKSIRLYISNFNSNDIIKQVSNLYVEHVWLYDNKLFNNMLDEIYRILEIKGLVSVDLSSITTIGYKELFDKIRLHDLNSDILELLEKREELSDFNMDKLVELFEKNNSNFGESQISKKINEHFFSKKKRTNLPEEKEKIYEIILILKSILINVGHEKRGIGNKSTYFSHQEIIDIYVRYFGLEGDSVLEVLKSDFKIFSMLGLDFANNLLFINGYESINNKQLDELSSGEFAMITRFMELAGKIENNSLVLIDEPETFLNPKWINEFIYILKKIFKNKDCHFIIASQSPFIIGSLNKEDIIKLTKENNKIIFKYEEEETFGADFNSIIEEIFNIDLVDNKLIKNYLTEIENKSENNILKSMRMISRLGDSKEKVKLTRKIANQKNIEPIKKEISEIEREYFHE